MCGVFRCIPPRGCDPTVTVDILILSLRTLNPEFCGPSASFEKAAAGNYGLCPESVSAETRLVCHFDFWLRQSKFLIARLIAHVCPQTDECCYDTLACVHGTPQITYTSPCVTMCVFIHYLLQNPKRIKNHNPYIPLVRKNIAHCSGGVLKQLVVIGQLSVMLWSFSLPGWWLVCAWSRR